MFLLFRDSSITENEDGAGGRTRFGGGGDGWSGGGNVVVMVLTRDFW